MTFTRKLTSSWDKVRTKTTPRAKRNNSKTSNGSQVKLTQHANATSENLQTPAELVSPANTDSGKSTDSIQDDIINNTHDSTNRTLRRSQKRNYFCFASEYLANLEEKEKCRTSSDSDSSIDENTSSPTNDNRRGDLDIDNNTHHATGGRFDSYKPAPPGQKTAKLLMAITEEEEQQELISAVAMVEFNIPSRRKFTQEEREDIQESARDAMAMVNPYRQCWRPSLPTIMECLETA